jgi:hypothetical protein
MCCSPGCDSLDPTLELLVLLLLLQWLVAVYMHALTHLVHQQLAAIWLRLNAHRVAPRVQLQP